MTAADTLNVPFDSIEYKGKTYPLRELTVAERARFSRWLEKRARDAVGRSSDVPADVYPLVIKAVYQDIAAGVYEWGGEACIKALLPTSPHGLAQVLYIMLSPGDPDFTEELATEIVLAKLGEGLAEQIEQASADPGNYSAPEESGATTSEPYSPTEG